MANDYSMLASAFPIASFTMTLGEMIAQGYDTDKSLGLDDYPIYDERHRDELNMKIVRHYAQREISAETPEQFAYYMRRLMHEIMPLYNQRYESAAKSVDFMSTINVVNDGTAHSTSEGTSQSSSHGSTSQDSTGTTSTDSSATASTKARSLTSDTPQMQLAGNEDYATQLTDTASDSTNDSHTTQNTTAHSDATTDVKFDHNQTSGKGDSSSHNESHGYSGVSPATLLDQWRQAMINVDLEIIYALEPCFMQLWDNGDAMLQRYGQYGWQDYC